MMRASSGARKEGKRSYRFRMWRGGGGCGNGRRAEVTQPSKFFCALSLLSQKEREKGGRKERHLAAGLQRFGYPYYLGDHFWDEESNPSARAYRTQGMGARGLARQQRTLLRQNSGNQQGQAMLAAFP